MCVLGQDVSKEGYCDRTSTYSHLVGILPPVTAVDTYKLTCAGIAFDNEDVPICKCNCHGFVLAVAFMLFLLRRCEQVGVDLANRALGHGEKDKMKERRKAAEDVGT